MDLSGLSYTTILVLILLDALLTAGRTGLTVLPDSVVKKMASSDNDRERSIASLLDRPSALLDGLELAEFTSKVALSLLAWPHLIYGLSALWRLASLDLRAPGFITLYALPALAFCLTVMLLHVLCELLPYKVACHHPRRCAMSLAWLCWLAAILFRPFVLLNSFLAGLLAKLFGATSGGEPDQVTEEEIRMMVDVGEEKGAIEQSEKDMINNIFEFDDRYVSEVMTHRTDMIAVSKDASLREVVEVATETGYSRIPVFDEDIDDVMGILYMKDLLCLIGNDQAEFHAESYMRKALFVPENMNCVDLFAQFKLKKIQVAIAVDEYGGTAGIVTMEDLLESIVGNIQDEYDDEEEEISKLSEGCYSIDGTVGIDEVERLFDVELDEDSDYDTIGGLLTEELQRIPSPDEHPSIELEGIRFTILLVEDRRIARIRAERIPSPSQGENGENPTT